jgi:hypothetical protein
MRYPYFRSSVLSLLVLPLLASRSLAQSAAVADPSPADSGAFVVLRGTDTMAVERYARTATELTGEMLTKAMGGQRQHYRVYIVEDLTTPLVEMSVWRQTDPESSPPRQRARVIFRDDSVAIDDANSTGMNTSVFFVGKGGLSYLNLSFAFLEQATMRARYLKGDSATVPFFNITGRLGEPAGESLNAIVRPVGKDSMSVKLGPVDFRLAVDEKGRILGGGVPTQNLVVVRR